MRRCVAAPDITHNVAERRKSDISISVDFYSSEHLKRILKFSRVNKCFSPSVAASTSSSRQTQRRGREGMSVIAKEEMKNNLQK